MKWVWVVAAVVVGVLAAVFISGGLGNLVGGNDSDPPCEDLPKAAAAEQALDEHQALVEKLSSVGDDVKVVVEAPCPDPDSALIVVQVGSAEEQSSVNDLLDGSEGFGVPVVVRDQ
jgi:hypothetical protein